MLERLPKLNPPLEELIEVPFPGTVTAVSSGAGAVVSIEWLREINAIGVETRRIDTAGVRLHIAG
jgi:hypothetical protein